MRKFTQKEQKQYDKLLNEIFTQSSLRDMSLAQLAKNLDIQYRHALVYYSHMLKSFSDTGINPQPMKCPSCGKSKKAVKDMSVCRDVFHYL
jgi:hypothetical protein